jgi:hypothetical protein
LGAYKEYGMSLGLAPAWLSLHQGY